MHLLHPEVCFTRFPYREFREALSGNMRQLFDCHRTAFTARVEARDSSLGRYRSFVLEAAPISSGPGSSIGVRNPPHVR